MSWGIILCCIIFQSLIPFYVFVICRSLYGFLQSLCFFGWWEPWSWEPCLFMKSTAFDILFSRPGISMPLEKLDLFGILFSGLGNFVCMPNLFIGPISLGILSSRIWVSKFKLDIWTSKFRKYPKLMLKCNKIL